MDDAGTDPEPDPTDLHPAEAPEGDALPDDLDVSAYRGLFQFPDIRRRRTAAWLYLGTAAICLGLWFARSEDPVLVNGGFLGAGILLVVVAAYHLIAAWPLAVREVEALLAAAGKVGFPVGHASAQLGWLGLRSRPTWRILLYSNEDPPQQRALVLVDGVGGEVLHHYVEANPEDWSAYDR